MDERKCPFIGQITPKINFKSIFQYQNSHDIISQNVLHLKQF